MKTEIEITEIGHEFYNTEVVEYQLIKCDNKLFNTYFEITLSDNLNSQRP